MRTGWIQAMLLVGLAGCSPPVPETCTVSGTYPMLVAELFFGRGNVDDLAWASFASETLTAHFPDGFTAVNAAGQWREAPGQPIGREHSQLVIIAAPDTQTTQDNLRALMDAYRAQFHQKFVGLILEHACAAF